ncbi:GYD domain-containing protein, partial [Micromonospora luteifusca]|uniref:GYD domain-containing protein n=1 Tax=Micromonospora luteifusca TaxID=709860 RepID=UPI0033B26EF4
MPTYIALLSWTDQGIRGYKDTAKRAEAFAAATQRLGANLLNIYWTVGPYDLVAPTSVRLGERLGRDQCHAA